jgi:predicted ATP-dependent serine protease
MFYCKECGTKNNWVESIVKSYGRCELCGETDICSELTNSGKPLSTLNDLQDCEGYKPGRVYLHQKYEHIILENEPIKESDPPHIKQIKLYMQLKR